ncbi:MAG: DUF4177 domain-containing protein [Paracoccaceae bacterium]
MQVYEYKVVPAPNRGEKTRDAKTPVDRFAATLAGVMNALGRDGWEYLRADTLPSEERSGFTKKVTVYHSVLVFRRPAQEKPEAISSAPRRLLTADAPEGKAPPLRAKAPDKVPDKAQEAAPEATSDGIAEDK